MSPGDTFVPVLVPFHHPVRLPNDDEAYVCQQRQDMYSLFHPVKLEIFGKMGALFLYRL